MIDLFLAMAVLCFLVAIMVYCVNKSIQALRSLNHTWKEYKKYGDELEQTIRKFYKEK